jgi:hypothetical protein
VTIGAVYVIRATAVAALVTARVAVARGSVSRGVPWGAEDAFAVVAWSSWDMVCPSGSGADRWRWRGREAELGRWS